MGLAAGTLNERVTFQSKTITQDRLGGEVATWADVDTVWAAVEAITGREVHAADQLESASTLRVIVRVRDDVDRTWRLMWGGKILSIDDVLPHTEKDRLTLLCSRGHRDD